VPGVGEAEGSATFGVGALRLVALRTGVAGVLPPPFEGGGCQQTELLVVVLADGIVSDVAQRGSGYCSRDGAESPAVVEDGASSLELMLGWAVGCHHLDEGKQEGTVVVCGPLRCHVCCL
jgi:hypothetical protein